MSLFGIAPHLKLAILVAFVFTTLPTAKAEQPSPQKTFSKHALFIELGGTGDGFSANYDYRFLSRLSLRIGHGGKIKINIDGTRGSYPDDNKTFAFANFILPLKNAMHFEIGAGPLIYSYDPLETSKWLLAGSAALRFHSPASRSLFLRMAVTLRKAVEGEPLRPSPTPGLSIGLSF